MGDITSRQSQSFDFAEFAIPGLRWYQHSQRGEGGIDAEIAAIRLDNAAASLGDR